MYKGSADWNLEQTRDRFDLVSGSLPSIAPGRVTARIRSAVKTKYGYKAVTHAALPDDFGPRQTINQTLIFILSLFEFREIDNFGTSTISVQ